MSVLEYLRKKDKEGQEKAKEEKGEVEVKGPSVAEILKDRTKSELFDLYLETEGEDHKPVLEKILQAKQGQAVEFSQSEITLLNEKRKGFLEQFESAHRAESFLKGREFKEIVDATPELKEIVDSFGERGVKDAATRHLARLAMTDRDRFEILRIAMTRLEEGQKEREKKEKELKALLKEHDLKEDEYYELAGKGQAEIKKALGEGMGRFKRWWNSEKIADQAFDLDQLTELRNMNKKLDDLLGDVGLATKAILMDNEFSHKVMVANLVGFENPPKPESTLKFSEFKHPLEFSEEKNEIMREDWDKHREKMKAEKGYDPDEMPDAFRDGEIRDFAMAFNHENIGTTKGKKGLFARIWEDLFTKQVAAALPRKPKPKS